MRLYCTAASSSERREVASTISAVFPSPPSAHNSADGVNETALSSSIGTVLAGDTSLLLVCSPVPPPPACPAPFAAGPLGSSGIALGAVTCSCGGS